MENILIARKDWSNAAAFIEFNPNTNMVRVFGKFYEEDGWRRRGYEGPATEWLETVPDELRGEVSQLVERKSWRPISSVQVSEDCLAFCDEIWKKAQEDDSWFRYSLKRDYFI